MNRENSKYKDNYEHMKKLIMMNFFFYKKKLELFYLERNLITYQYWLIRMI